MRNLLCGLFVLFCTAANAHPSVGIVQDSRGNIFYTDLTHVWQIDPSGRRTIAVRNVHTHELCLDADDALYGEHLWYNGDARGTWGHFVWRRNADNTIDTVIGKREGFRKEYSFVRDSRGTMYWVDRSDRERIMKRPVNGTPEPVSSSLFSGVGWLHVTPNGTVYVRERGTLHRIDPRGQKQTIGTIGQHGSSGLLHGLWSDRSGNLYLADGKLRQVTKIDAQGNISVAYRSDGTWAPSGGVFAADGTLWLLEYSPANTVRVQQIGPNGRIRVF